MYTLKTARFTLTGGLIMLLLAGNTQAATATSQIFARVLTPVSIDSQAGYITTAESTSNRITSNIAKPSITVSGQNVPVFSVSSDQLRPSRNFQGSQETLSSANPVTSNQHIEFNQYNLNLARLTNSRNGEFQPIVNFN